MNFFEITASDLDGSDVVNVRFFRNFFFHVDEKVHLVLEIDDIRVGQQIMSYGTFSVRFSQQDIILPMLEEIPRFLIS